MAATFTDVAPTFGKEVFVGFAVVQEDDLVCAEAEEDGAGALKEVGGGVEGCINLGDCHLRSGLCDLDSSQRTTLERLHNTQCLVSHREVKAYWNPRSVAAYGYGKLLDLHHLGAGCIGNAAA